MTECVILSVLAVITRDTAVTRGRALVVSIRLSASEAASAPRAAGDPPPAVRQARVLVEWRHDDRKDHFTTRSRLRSQLFDASCTCRRVSEPMRERQQRHL